MSEPRILFIKNISHEDPGVFEDVAFIEHIPFVKVDLAVGDEIPDVRNYQAVVVMGGPASANDTSPQILQEIQSVQGCLEHNIPYLGICLGLQLLVKAAGGDVFPSSYKEIGFYDGEAKRFEVQLTSEGTQDVLLEGIPFNFPLFQLHGETVTMTPGAMLLGEAKHCKNQIVKVGNYAYGIQGHIELTRTMLEAWQAKDADLRTLDLDDLLEQYRPIQDSMTKISVRIFQNFLKLAQFKLESNILPVL